MTGAVLSVAVPTRNRPQLLERALRSFLSAAAGAEELIEVAVSDGSTGTESGELVAGLLAGWPGGLHYVRNDPPLPMITNINRAIDLCTAPWILQLHDDDYLLPDSGPVILKSLRAAHPGERVLLFGVEVVDEHGAVRKRQTFRRDRRLDPPAALRRLLRTSGFIRQPAVVIHRTAYDEVGMYDSTLGGPADTEMYVRLLSRYGVRLVARTTCAYTVHAGAATAGMWNPATIDTMTRIFDGAAAQGIVPERMIRNWQTDFFHQFILAGTYRGLRAKQPSQALRTLELFDLPEVARLGRSLRWTAVRTAFRVAATVGRPGQA